MSGVEVAGFVLAAIPLIISALEHYGEGVSTIKRICDYQPEFRCLSRRLRVEGDIFRNTMELLLHDSVDDQILAELLNNVGGSAWSDQSVQQALQRKLSASYGVYFETIQDMSSTLRRFKERLHLADNGEVPFKDPKSFRQAFKRFRFGLNRSAYMDLMQELQRDNSSLAKLTEQSSALEPARAARKRIPNFETIRAHASSLFGTLQRGLRASCQASHGASLYMKSGAVDCMSTSPSSDFNFRIVLHHQSNTLRHAIPDWWMEEAEVRLLDAQKSNPSNIPTAVQFPPAARGGRRSVRFQIPSPQVQLTPLTPQSHQQVFEIRDLCMRIQHLRPPQYGVCLGYLLDDSNAHRHGLYWPQKPLVDSMTPKSFSLRSLLAGQQSDARLSVAESRQLAASLAHGILRLHNTPWLGNQWVLDNVTLFVQNGKFLVDHPFVSTDISAGRALQIPNQTSCQSFPPDRQDSLFALGVVLIELCLGMVFDDLRVADDLNADGTSHAASDLLTAYRMLDEVYDKAGGRYGDVVRRCIERDFDQRKKTLEDDKFCKAVYENVVTVLEEDVRQFFHLS